MSLVVFINSNIEKIIVYPDQYKTVMTNMDEIERKFEFHISNDQIQEISRAFGPQILNNTITGRNANQIVETYVMPLIESSPMHSLFLEILNPF
jgi:tetrahydromethanopterin S-methyltransferase subunit G